MKNQSTLLSRLYTVQPGGKKKRGLWFETLIINNTMSRIYPHSSDLIGRKLLTYPNINI